MSGGSAGNRRVSAIILAAGASSRMGRPKAGLLYRGETFLGRLVRIFRMYCEDVIVVRSVFEPVEHARAVVNPAPERGMLSSLQCGISAVPDAADAFAFTPVDYPAISESTVSAVVEGWRGELLRIPRYQGRRGHPVLASRSLIAEFLAAAPETAQAREIVRRHESEIVYADVDDAGILTDVDTPADYGQLR